MSTSTASIIDVSLDFSKAEVLVNKTLQKTIEVESRVDRLQGKIIIAADGLNLNDAIFRELEVRSQGIDDEIVIHRIKLQVIDEFSTLEEARILASQNKQEVLDQKQKEIDQAIETANNRALANFRRTAAFGTYIFQALGVSIGQTLTLLAETVSLAVETAKTLNTAALAAAVAGGPVGIILYAAGIAIRLALIAGLLYLQVQILNHKNRVDQEFQSLVGALRIITI